MIGTSLILLARSALLALGVAAPDSAVIPVTTLPAIEVRRERERLDARRRLPTASVTELRANASNRATESLSELLATCAGARVIQYGGMGTFSTLSLRGAPPGQVSIYLDGVPLTSAAHGVVDLTSLPAGTLDRIEVYRGLAPAGFGPMTPGGAVNLVTADRPDALALHASAGSFGSWDGRGTAAASHGAWSALAHAGYAGSRGDFAYRSDNGTPFNPDDDRTLTRANDRFDATSALARVSWAPRPGVRMSVRGEALRKAQGVPGQAATPAPHPRLAFERAVGAWEAVMAPAERLPGLTLRAHAQRERSRFRDTEGELGLGRQDTDERFFDRGFAAELATPAAWPVVTAGLGASARREDAEPAPPTLGQPAPPASRRDGGGAFASVQLHLVRDALLVHAARRWDRQHDRLRATIVGGLAYASDVTRELDAPQLGARLRLPRALEARANWSKSQRAPEFLELFGNQGDVTGNPRLVPERGEGWDAGFAWRGRLARGAASVDWARFATHERNLIAFWPASQRSSRAVNVERAEIRGEEFSFRLAWTLVALAGSTGWTSALQTGRGSIYYGRRLPQRPARQSYLRLDAHRGAWSLAGDVLYLGDDYLDPINFRRVPSRTLLGASLARTFAAARLTLEGKNLGDSRVQDVGGYPLPGRGVFVALDVSHRVSHHVPS